MYDLAIENLAIAGSVICLQNGNSWKMSGPQQRVPTSLPSRYGLYHFTSWEMNAPYPKENDETEFIKLHNEAASSYVLSTKRINHACQYIPFTYYVKLYTYNRIHGHDRGGLFFDFFLGT